MTQPPYAPDPNQPLQPPLDPPFGNDQQYLQPEDPNPQYGYPQFADPQFADPRYAASYGYGYGYGATVPYAPPQPYGQPTKRTNLPLLAGGLVLVAAVVIGVIVLSGGGNTTRPAAGGPYPNAAPSGSAASAGNGFPAAPNTGLPNTGLPNTGLPNTGLPSVGSAGGGDLSCLQISATPPLSGAFENLQTTTEAPPSSVPLPASTPTASCSGDLQFTDGSQDPALVYSYAGVTPNAYEDVLTAAGWSESYPATIDQPAVWDLDSSDYEIDFLTSGADLIVIVDDAAAGSNGFSSAPSAVTPS